MSNNERNRQRRQRKVRTKRPDAPADSNPSLEPLVKKLKNKIKKKKELARLAALGQVPALLATAVVKIAIKDLPVTVITSTTNDKLKISSKKRKRATFPENRIADEQIIVSVQQKTKKIKKSKKTDVDNEETKSIFYNGMHFFFFIV